MIKYDNLLGIPFEHGTNDCFSLTRNFFAQNFDIQIPNYARPNSWWSQGLDMYRERFHKNGFRILDVHPSEYQMGDVFLMSILSEVSNHVAILVENGQILHHFTGRLSRVEPYKGIWRNCTMAVLRHKDIVLDAEVNTVNLVDTLPPNIKRKIDAQAGAAQKAVRVL